MPTAEKHPPPVGITKIELRSNGFNIILAPEEKYPLPALMEIEATSITYSIYVI